MKVAVFSAKPYDRKFLENANANAEAGHSLVFFEPSLTPATVRLAEGFDAVCVFVHDELTAEVLSTIAKGGTRFVALRCAGFNNIDLLAAGAQGIRIARVPSYSPHSVAEHAVALMLALNRGIHRAHARVREGNFALNGLLGFDLSGKSVGIIGTGKIGQVAGRILSGFGCRLSAYDPSPDPRMEAMGARYVELPELYASSDIITLHCPLSPETHHLIGTTALDQMKEGVMLINTSRGGLVDTLAMIDGLKAGRIGYLGLDVYEEEAHLFYEDLSGKVLQDDVFARLLTFPNVIITSHQAFFTEDAMRNIAETTIANISSFAAGLFLEHEVSETHMHR